MVNSILTEWRFRLESGYPKSEADYAVLRDVILEMTDLSEADADQIVRQAQGITEADDDISQDPADQQFLENNDIDTIVTAFTEISDRYGKYLKIFSMFDPNSLGTISEVLLAKLLDNLPNIQSHHTGGAQTLDDLTVNGKGISLKTTETGKDISLGSDIRNIDDRNIKGILDFLKTFSKEELTEKPIKDLIQPNEGDSDDIKKAKQSIRARLESIINKITGPDTGHYFVWVEKIKKSGSGNPITAIRIHINEYNKQILTNLFYNAYADYSNKGWRIWDNTKTLISSDSAYKYLNITPYTIELTSVEREPILIDLSASITKLPDPELEISNQLLNVLEKLSNDLFGNNN